MVDMDGTCVQFGGGKRGKYTYMCLFVYTL